MAKIQGLYVNRLQTQLLIVLCNVARQNRYFYVLFPYHLLGPWKILRSVTFFCACPLAAPWDWFAIKLQQDERRQQRIILSVQRFPLEASHFVARGLPLETGLLLDEHRHPILLVQRLEYRPPHAFLAANIDFVWPIGDPSSISPY